MRRKKAVKKKILSGLTAALIALVIVTMVLSTLQF
jgi:uncharacterized membrane protein